MSNAHLFYPNCISSIRVAYILDNRTFIEDTAYFNVKSNINYLIKTNIKLFKGLNIDLKCMCEYGNVELRIGIILNVVIVELSQKNIKIGKVEKYHFFLLEKYHFFLLEKYHFFLMEWVIFMKQFLVVKKPVYVL